MKIEHTSSPESQDIMFLAQKINEETPDFCAAYPFAFFIRSKNGSIIAGCNGVVIYGMIYTEQLWVHHNHRKQGLGRKLMENIHSYGCKAGCAIATVATMDFQGTREFYEHLGYESDFQRAGYAKNSSCIFLKKIL